MQDIVEYAINLPVLTLDEERALVQDYIATKSVNASRKLVLHHMKIVIPMAFKLRRRYASVDDLIQEGNLGLINALKNYDLNCNVRFGTFARQYVKSAMLEYMLCNFRIAKVATTQDQRKCFFNLNKFKNNVSELMTDAQIEDMASRLNVTPETVSTIDERVTLHQLSTDVDDYCVPLTQFEEDVIQEEWHGKTMSRVSTLIDSLDERTRDIIQSRWMSETQTTLKELAAKYGVSTSRISEIEKLTLAKIRENLDVVSSAC